MIFILLYKKYIQLNSIQAECIFVYFYLNKKLFINPLFALYLKVCGITK